MKITSKREKYINNECPFLTKSIMDVFYSKLLISTRNHIDVGNIKQIDSLNVRVNQAYAGFHILHFYVSINGMPEFDVQVSTYDKPQGITKYHRKIDLKKKPRFQWIVDFERILDINMGDNNCKQRLDEIWDSFKQKSKSKERVKRLRRDIQELNRLQAVYSN